MTHSDRNQQEPGTEPERWSQVLEQVLREQDTGRPWWQNAALFAAWSAGLALAASALATLSLLIASLFSPQHVFSARNVSDWVFWASMILLFAGLIAPATGNLGELTQPLGSQDHPAGGVRTMRRRIRRVYNPWRWRLWMAGLLTLGIAILVGSPGAT